MKNVRLTVAAIALLLLLGVALAWLLPRGGRGSALARGPEGWAAARFYLEARGAEVRLLDRSPEQLEIDGVLVEVFPWRGLDPDRVRGLRRHLARGGTLVLAYSGALDLIEDRTLEALGLPLRPVRGEPPTHPRAWRADSRLEWRLTVEDDSGSGGERRLVLPAPRWAPEAPEEASVLYRAPGGKPLVFAVGRGGGLVWVLPAPALANASLDDGGNADLLEGLLAALGNRWSFDENAHGLVAPGAATYDRLPRAFDLILVHLAVLYLLAAVTLSRRFGPAWRPRPAATGSVATYLGGLGRLHDRYGHHREGARKLAERWHALHPRMPQPPASAAESVGDAGGLVALGRYLARRLSDGATSGILAADPAGEEERAR